jgi:copper chaperone CopZ
MKTKFIVEGFHCGSCEMLVKDVAEDFPSITSINVDVKTGKVVFEHTDKFEFSKFKKEIESLGKYKVVA